ncbi:MAG: HAD-IA family hydrolase [Thermococci archaeon]|nr:HAD-IA family hydrolase [Thermococci archaeon]
MDVRLVVFDLDGTLIGSKEPFSSIKRKLRDELIRRGIEEQALGELTPMYEGLLRLSEVTGVPFRELHGILVSLEKERMKESFIFDGVVELLEFLRSRGIKTAVMTRSSREAAELGLRKNGIAEYFDLLVAREDVSPGELKPEPGQLLKITESLGVPPSKTVVVGDHGYDVMAAKAAGSISILVTSQEYGRMSFDVSAEPDFRVEKIGDVGNLLRKLLNTCVVIPAYNEEKTIKAVINDLLRYFRKDELVVVNDGSRDGTERIVRQLGVRVLTHLVNRGLGGALGTGIKYAVRKGADLILTFDADGQHLVEDAIRVMAPVAEGRADFSVGSRLLGDTSQMPAVKRFGNKVLDFITAIFSRRLVSDTQSGLRCFSRDCASKIEITCDRYAVSSEIIIEVSKAGCRVAEVPIKAVYTDYAMRKGTNVKEGLRIALNLLIDVLR